MMREIQKKFQVLKKSRKGFSLAEVLIVMAIIGILSVLSAPELRNALMSSRKTACEADIKTIGDAVTRYYAETGKLPSGNSINELKTELTKDDMEIDGRKVGPWMKENMNTADPWGQEFTVSVDGNKFDICSKGDPSDSKEICYNKLGRNAKN